MMLPSFKQTSVQESTCVHKIFHYMITIFNELKVILRMYNMTLVVVSPLYLIDILSDKINDILFEKKSEIF